MDIDLLRRATAKDHRAVEDSLPLMHPHLTLPEYTAVLQRMYSIVLAWETHLERSAPPWLQAIVLQRQRRTLLHADLLALGISLPEAHPEHLPTLPALPTEAALLGAMYVMEGSRLGGQLIAKHVEDLLALTPGHGDAYFRGCGPVPDDDASPLNRHTGPMWREFLDILRTRVPEPESDTVIEAAKAMFQTVGAWMSPPAPYPGTARSTASHK